MAEKKIWKATSGKMGRNVAFAVSDKGIMTLTIDLNLDLGPSSSGKSNIVSSTDGNATIDGGNGAVLGLNCYRKASK